MYKRCLMNHKLSKIEIVITAIIFLIACIGIGLTVYKPVNKGQGELTTENYTDYMQVTCSTNIGFSDGITMWYNYDITITASPYHSLENVTISFSLKSYDDTITASIEAGKSYTEKCSVSFEESNLEIIIKSVTGTYIYRS